jgi:hypothetical protein
MLQGKYYNGGTGVGNIAPNLNILVVEYYIHNDARHKCTHSHIQYIDHLNTLRVQSLFQQSIKNILETSSLILWFMLLY